jgi:hypothetical protein
MPSDAIILHRTSAPFCNVIFGPLRMIRFLTGSSNQPKRRILPFV